MPYRCLARSRILNLLLDLCLHTGWVRSSRDSFRYQGQGALALPHSLMKPFAILGGLWTIRIHAMHLNSFLQAFNRLGLTQWEGIEQDIAWGHVTSLMGLARPSIDGPIFIYRAPCRLGGLSPHRV